MTDFDQERRELSRCYGRCVLSAAAIIILAIIGLLLSSCSTVKYIPVETVKTEYKTIRDSFIQKDSIFLKDSVFILSKGDTVVVEKWHTKYVDRVRDVVHTDSFIKRDSIQVPYPVERKLSKWEQTKIDYGGWAILILVVIVYIIIWLVANKLRR